MPDIFSLLTRKSAGPAGDLRPPIAQTAAKLIGRQPHEAPTSIRNLDDRDVPLDVGPLIERDPHPIPAESDREHYCEKDDAGYWMSGLRDYLKVKTAVERHAKLPAGRAKFLDFGCASGRVLRHAHCQEADAEVWGCDIDRDNVEWILKHLPPAIRVFQNSVFPSLPLGEATFDVVTAFSVFTHIDTFEDTWLLELRRILRPGGIACVTIHSERTWLRVPQFRSVLEAMLRCRAAPDDGVVTQRMFEQPMPFDRIVLNWTKDSVYSANVFHSMRWIRDRWGRFFTVCGIYDGGREGFQDLVVLRRD